MEIGGPVGVGPTDAAARRGHGAAAPTPLGHGARGPSHEGLARRALTPPASPVGSTRLAGALPSARRAPNRTPVRVRLPPPGAVTSTGITGSGGPVEFGGRAPPGGVSANSDLIVHSSGLSCPQLYSVDTREMAPTRETFLYTQSVCRYRASPPLRGATAPFPPKYLTASARRTDCLLGLEKKG